MHDSRIFLSTLPPSQSDRRLAVAVVAVSAVLFAALAPFARMPLAPVPGFLPTYQSALILNDLITGVLLLGQYRSLRSRGLMLLGCGYLFNALIAFAHLLSFPGLFAQGGLLGAGPQSTAWLYMFWHGGFPVLVIAYSFLKEPSEDAHEVAEWPLLAGLGLAAGAAIGFTVLSTRGEDLLPAIMIGHRQGPGMTMVVGSVWGLSLLALAALWRKRPRSVLDVWLMVVMSAWIFDIALSAMLNGGRYDLGWYAGRAYGLFAATFVLIVLLLENSLLYTRLERALEGEHAERQRAEDRTVELNEFNERLEARIAERSAQIEASNRDLRREASERRAAESDALEARRRLDGIIDSAMDAIITVDDNQNIVLFNATAESVFGCPRAEALGRPLEQFIPSRFRGGHRGHVRNFGQAGEGSRRMSAQRVVTGLRRNGEEFPIDASISKATLNGRRFYTVILRDVTERTRAEEALRRSKDELHEMAVVSSTAREQEKARIARELHDELGQSLTALRMDLTWLKERRLPGDEAHAAKLAGMETILAGTIAATRHISTELRPMMLDDLGIVPAASWLVDNLREHHGIDCALVVEPPDFELGDPHATAVFRILQESLTNIAKHASASKVGVSLTRAHGQIVLRVSDNGRGFDASTPRKSGSFGLVGLRERAYLVGGQLTVDSGPGRGTSIEIRIPLHEAAAENVPD